MLLEHLVQTKSSEGITHSLDLFKKKKTKLISFSETHYTIFTMF